EEALRLYTQGSSWFSTEDGKKGTLAEGQLADLAVLSDDYFAVPEENIKGIESVLTIVDGKIVYGRDDFSSLSPAPIPFLPEWSPASVVGGYGAPLDLSKAVRAGVPLPRSAHAHTCSHLAHRISDGARALQSQFAGFWGTGCDCFAF